MKRNQINTILAKCIKEIVFKSPARRYCFPRYLYMFTPPQLCFLCQCVEDTKCIEGAIAEIGCAAGHTTIFLNKYLDAQNIQKDYYCVDTFSGFVEEDISYEVDSRSKTKDLYTLFQANNKRWFDGTMGENDINRVRSIQADVNVFDLTTLGPLCFCLLDVDLYRPMKKGLQELYEVLSPCGVMVVDDCDALNRIWDGSDQAYKEFMRERNLTPQIVHGKLGIIRKPA